MLSTSAWRSTGGGSGGVARTTNSRRLSSGRLALHATAISAVVLMSLGSGFLLARFTDAAYPYVDSLTTFAALWATFLVARKVLENWWYWLLIDAVSVVIYWDRGLELTALLFVVYLAMIPFGLLAWSRSRVAQVAAMQT